MEEKQHICIKNFILQYRIPFFVLIIASILILLAFRYELSHIKRAELAAVDAKEKEEVIQSQIDEKKEKEELLDRQFILDTEQNSCIILCFDEFEDSVYKSVITKMDEYHYPGVIVFRDNNMPGMPGSISLELYKELLSKGWEGAVSASDEMILYEYMGEAVLSKWRNYLGTMKAYFENNGLEFPHTYVLQSGEEVITAKKYFDDYGITAYTTIYDNVSDVKTDMSNDMIMNMGMIKGKYSYTSLSDDIKWLTYYGQSVAIRFLEIESSAPKDTSHNSIYRVGTYLNLLRNSAGVLVTTFSGYQEYQAEFLQKEAEKIQKYKNDRNKLETEIEQLKQENRENYRKVVSCYISFP